MYSTSKIYSKSSLLHLPKLVNRLYGTGSLNNKESYDLIIVGGGIVGLATARQLSVNFAKMGHSKVKMLLLEKESELSLHQTGHNSGVIHAGIYYTPGSLKAKLCVEGMHATYKYCDEKNIPYKKVGKLIVALDQDEVSKMDELKRRGELNNVPDLKILNSEEITAIEPNCRGLKAIYSPHTGIIDYRQMALSFGEDFKQLGGKIILDSKVEDISESKETPDYPVLIHAKNSKNNQSLNFITKNVITCCGLYSDIIAEKSGCNRSPRIVPFRGDYLLLRPEKRNLIKCNIYPVPNPKFPFLGVHFTPRINGEVWLGPNAVWAFKREGYGLFDFNLKEFFDSATYPGFLKLASRNLSFGLEEMYQAMFIKKTIKKLRRYVPSLEDNDVIRGPSGVRAQALDINGNLVDDFVFDSGKSSISKRIMHVRNAPSPAATSSLAIGRMISEKAKEIFEF